jgi:ribosomal protein S12 methylthiotransferase accessory factor
MHGAIKLHTSHRSIPPEQTLQHAKALAAKAGIRVVSDITPLDCLGLPVFMSERPGAGLLTYSFGKGVASIESEVGAYMEAIEDYFAHPGNDAVVSRWGTPRDLSGVGTIADPAFEFAPIAERKSDPDQPMLLVRAEDVESGAEGWVPAELVFIRHPNVGASLYGVSTNGLAAGNSVLEASLHAIFELIERDIWSIEFVRNASLRVVDDSLPPEAREVVETATRNGLGFVIRTVPNDYGMPFFATFLFDPEKPLHRFFNGGWGCHLDRRIALMRAVTEAAQSRAASLHGGRELPEWNGPGAESDGVRAQMDSISGEIPAIRFEDIPEPGAAASLAAQWDATLGCLRRVIDRPVYRVVYTAEEGPIHVVRLVVPTMEHFSKFTMRVGPRLTAELEASAEEMDAVA